MNHSVQAIQLDLDGNLMAPTVNVQKGDTKTVIRISLWNGLNRYHLQGDTLAVLAAKKPDETSLYNVCSIQDNEVIYAFTDQTASCLGLMKAELKLYGGNKQLITTMYFFIAVHDTAFKPEDAAKSQDEQTALDDRIHLVQDLQKELLQQREEGSFNGESAYEIALRLGYKGTESQWLQSLRYDHSEEFTALSQQVTDAAAAAARNAQTAEDSAGSAVQSAQAAQRSAVASETAAGQAETQAQNAAESAKASIQAEKSASAGAAEAVKQAECSLQAASDAQREADRAAETLKGAATKQEAGNALRQTVTGEVITVDDISPLPHRINCRVSSKNLFHISKAKLISLSCQNGVFRPTLTDTAPNLGFKVVLFHGSEVIAQSAIRPNKAERLAITVTAEKDSDLLWLSNTGHTTQSNLAFPLALKRGETITVSFTLLTLGVNTWSYRDVQIEYGDHANSYTEGYINFDGVSLCILGKNLSSVEEIYSPFPDYLKTTFDGKECVRFSSAENVMIPIKWAKDQTQYSVSFETKWVDNGSTGPNSVFTWYYSDGSFSNCRDDLRETDWHTLQFTSTLGKTIVGVGIRVTQYKIFNYIDINTFQIEEGANCTSYEKHLERTYANWENGIPSNLCANSSVTTIYANAPGILTSLSYNQDISIIIQKLFCRISELENIIAALN